MSWHVAASLALLYLVLYTILFVHLVALYSTRKITLRSRYTVITFHVLVRLASQATGLAFALVGYANVSLLVAYFVLGAEGYFTLVLCTYRFLVAWQHEHFLSGESWLEPKRVEGEKWGRRFLGAFLVYVPGEGKEKPRPMGLIHNLLIVANTMIVVGGSMLTGGSNSPDEFGSDRGKVQTAKILRTVGQTIFLLINIALLIAIALTIRQARDETRRSKREDATPQSSIYPHPTLILLLIAWPLLIVRGLYGLLNSFVDPFNYFVAANYDAHGLTLQFVIYEYVLGTTMEWVSCALLIGSWWTERYKPGRTVENV